MDASTIMKIKPALTEFLRQFDDCYARSKTRNHTQRYVQGQLSNLPRKSIEPMADAAGVPPRTLQEFLSLSRWDESMMRDRLQQRVARLHTNENSVGIMDETSYIKKGKKTACVQRQHCGAAGKIDNCVVSVHLGYATPEDGGFHAMLDGELYMPKETWHEDRERCAEAGVGDEVVYRTKHQIAWEQYQRAVGNGVNFAWLTFDEFYGRHTGFLRQFDAVGQHYVAEVPCDFHVWTQRPAVLDRPSGGEVNQPGRPRAYPRLKEQNSATSPVDQVLKHSPVMNHQPWVAYYVKDGAKGPMVWEAKHAKVYIKDDRGLPAFDGRAYHLIIARNPLNHDEVKYSISNAPESTAVETLLLVAFSRWGIERMFEDGKMELGMDHFEVRKFGSINRHLILSCVSYLFLAEFRKRHDESGERKKKGADREPAFRRAQRAGGDMVRQRSLLAQEGPKAGRANAINPAAQYQGGQKRPQAKNPTIRGHWPPAENLDKVSMAEN